MKDKPDNISAYSDPGNMGIVQFKTKAVKIGFLKKIRDYIVQWARGDKMWCKNNEPIEKRIVDKILGQNKHNLMDKGHEQKSIRIFWDGGQRPILKGKAVAEVTPDGNITAYGEGDDIKKQLNDHMAKWMAARSLQ